MISQLAQGEGEQSAATLDIYKQSYIQYMHTTNDFLEML